MKSIVLWISLHKWTIRNDHTHHRRQQQSTSQLSPAPASCVVHPSSPRTRPEKISTAHHLWFEIQSQEPGYRKFASSLHSPLRLSRSWMRDRGLRLRRGRILLCLHSWRDLWGCWRRPRDIKLEAWICGMAGKSHFTVGNLAWDNGYSFRFRDFLKRGGMPTSDCT